MKIELPNRLISIKSIKKLVISVMTLVILTSQLAGCATVTSTEMLDMLNRGQDIEISIAVPNYGIKVDGTQQELNDVQLDQLQTYTTSGFRGDFDTLFGIKPIQLPVSDSKSGCIYINKVGEQEGNTSFMDSLRNKVFMETYFNSPDIQAQLQKLATQIYIDVDGENYDSVMAALNGYYNLLSDGTTGDSAYFNPTQSLNRGDYYSFVYRAANPVNNFLKESGDFSKKLNITNSNAVYASQVESKAWLNTANNGLRTGNYDEPITRAEAIYLLMNTYFSDELSKADPTFNLSDAKDGGLYQDDTIPSKKESDQLYSTDSDKKLASGWQLGALSKMLKSSDGGVQTDLYKSLVLANQLGIIPSETRYNEPLSKSEAIELVIAVMVAMNERDGYQTTEAVGSYLPDSPIITDTEPDPVVDWVEPPVTIMYDPANDLNNDGHVDKAEWEAYIAAHPEDLNKDMVITSEEKTAYEASQNPGTMTPPPAETQKPVQTPPSSGGSTQPPATQTPEEEISQGVKDFNQEQTEKVDEAHRKWLEEQGIDPDYVNEDLEIAEDGSFRY